MAHADVSIWSHSCKYFIILNYLLVLYLGDHVLRVLPVLFKDLLAQVRVGHPQDGHVGAEDFPAQQIILGVDPTRRNR